VCVPLLSSCVCESVLVDAKSLLAETYADDAQTPLIVSSEMKRRAASVPALRQNDSS